MTAPPPSLALDAGDAGAILGVPGEVVLSLAEAGYLRPVESAEGPRFAASDLKALAARMSDGPALGIPTGLADPLDVDPEALLAALDGKSAEMARRAFDAFCQVVPDAHDWSLDRQASFIEEARHRFDLLISITESIDSVDDELLEDLRMVGAAAANDATSLPHLLVLIRISRDLLVRTAIEIAEEHGQHWGLALSLVLGRILPAIDRLTDAVADGYWHELVDGESEARRAHEHVLEHTQSGVYEADADGIIEWSNARLSEILGRPGESLVGERITQLFGGDVTAAMLIADPGADQDVIIETPSGMRRTLRIHTIERRDDRRVVGHQGIVGETGLSEQLDAWRTRVLASLTTDLRQPLSSVLGLGATLTTYAGELPTERLAGIGRTIHRQAERMSRLVDDLREFAEVEPAQVTQLLRTVKLAGVVEGALVSVEPRGVVVVDVDDVRVRAHPRRLEQVVSNVLELAPTSAASVVRISCIERGERVGLTVAATPVTADVNDGNLADLFGDRLRLVRRLVRQMGGSMTDLGVTDGTWTISLDLIAAG